MRLVMLACMALLAGSGCASSRAEAPRLILVRAQDDHGTAIVGAAVDVEGIATVRTAADGTARVSLSARGSPRARVGVTCPAAYRPLEPRHVLRQPTAGSTPLELSFVCRPKLRTLVVVARAEGGAGLVLRADGAPVGTLGSDDTLHAVLRRPPDSDLRLLLDTGERPLTPRQPTRELRVADRDEVVVFDQPLQRVKPVAIRRAKPPPSAVPAPRPLPYAIRSTH